MTRWAILVVSNYVLWMLICQANYYLSPYQVYLSIPGLFITLAALRMSFNRGLATSLLTGLMIDACEPVSFGTHMLLLGALHCFIYSIRGRFPRDELSFKILAALFANAVIFLGITIIALRHSPAVLSSLARLSADLFISEVLIVLIAPWYLSFQTQILEWIGVNLNAEERGIL